MNRRTGGAALALWLVVGAVLPAQAGSLTLTVTTAQGTVTHTVTVPDAHFARIVAAYKAMLALAPASTDAQAFQALAKSLFDGIKDNVLSYERAAARSTAEVGVAPVNMQ